MNFLCTNCNGKVTVSEPDQSGDQEITCPKCQQKTAVPPTPLSPRVVINDFVIKRKIAEGGMGTVYLAHQITLDRDVALKILKEKYSILEDYVGNFIKEARAAAKLNHPNIVQAYAVGEEDGYHFFAMELIEGKSLQTILDKDQRIDVDIAVEIIMQISDALDCAWNKQKMVHRDVKPDNIMLTTDGVAKLADLGLAQLTTDLRESSDDDDTVMGTPHYICPETLIGNPLDIRSDLYSLGATLFHAITGECPFTGTTPIEVASKHLNEQVRLPCEVRPEISQNISLIIAKVMAKNPDDRYQSGQEFNIALTNAIGKTSPKSEEIESDTNIWQCGHCSKTNKIENKYCIYCGALGIEPCVLCQKEIRVGVQFCSHCGGDVAEKKRLILEENVALFDELEEAIGLADIDKSREIVKKINEIGGDAVREDLPVRYAQLLADLRKIFEGRLAKAREHYDLNKVGKIVDEMVAALGEAACSDIIAEIAAIKKKLSDCIFQADMAMSVNCFSLSKSILDSADPWRFKDIGCEDKLAAAYEKCSKLVQERDNAMRMTKVQIRNANFVEAIRSYKDVIKFRRSDRITNVEPSPADLEFNVQIDALFKHMSEEIEGVIQKWIDADKWDDLKATLDVAANVEILSKERVEELRKQLKTEVVERYNTAVAAEQKKDFRRAAAAWKRLLKIPAGYLPAQQRQYATEYRTRQHGFILQKREKFVTRTYKCLFALWCYPLIMTIVTIIFRRSQFSTFQDVLNYFVPVVIQLAIFMCAAKIISKRKMLKPDEVSDELLPPRLLIGLCLLIVISPMSYVLFDLYGIVMERILPGSFLTHPVIIILLVALIWTGLDILRNRDNLRDPTSYGLGMSWIVGTIVAWIIPVLSFDTPAYFSGLAVIHGILFAISQVIHTRFGKQSLSD